MFDPTTLADDFHHLIDADFATLLADALSGGEHDNEANHVNQDAVFLKALLMIATGGTDSPQELALQALKPACIEYERWFA